MWIVVDVNDPSDVGKSEKRRVIINDISITQDPSKFFILNISANGYEVHPATQTSEI